MAKQAPAVLKEVSVSLPFGVGSAKWHADPTEQNAVWQILTGVSTW